MSTYGMAARFLANRYVVATGAAGFGAVVGSCGSSHKYNKIMQNQMNAKIEEEKRRKDEMKKLLDEKEEADKQRRQLWADYNDRISRDIKAIAGSSSVTNASVKNKKP